MTKEQQIEKLTKLKSDLFNFANEIASNGKHQGVIAGELHEAANRCIRCIKMLENGITQADSDEQMDEWMNKQSFPIPPSMRAALKQLRI